MNQQSENIQIRNDATSTTEANQGRKRGGGRERDRETEGQEEGRKRERGTVTYHTGTDTIVQDPWKIINFSEESFLFSPSDAPH